VIQRIEHIGHFDKAVFVRRNLKVEPVIILLVNEFRLETNFRQAPAGLAFQLIFEIIRFAILARSFNKTRNYSLALVYF
jgi:hypothetical protein